MSQLHSPLFITNFIMYITILAAVVTSLFLYLRHVYTTFSRAGVNCLPPVPFFGNIVEAIFGTEHVLHTLLRGVSAFPEDKVVGHFELMTPIYNVQDVELIKKITIRDFEYFVNRRSFASDCDPMFGKSLFNLKDKDWRNMRPTLTPAFTSAKMRMMVPLMKQVGERMNKVLRQKIEESGNKYLNVDLADLTTRYSNDVIAAFTFGLSVDSHTSDNDFFLHANKISQFTVLRLLKIYIISQWPNVANKLNLVLAPKETTEFFTEVMLTIMKDHANNNNTFRHDATHLLQKLKDEWSDEYLLAQLFLFYAAGIESISTSMMMTLHELTTNRNVQDKLVEDIKRHDAGNGGNFDFNSIQSMKYLDMVVSESLRKYPLSASNDRICTKDYNVGRVNKTAKEDLILRRGDIIGIPTVAFHYDPELFPEPHKFDPERFSEENKDNIKPFSYRPFGNGPRSCIGSRLAICEIKVIVYQLLREMKLLPYEKTCVPTQLAGGFMMRVKDGAWVRLQLRD